MGSSVVLGGVRGLIGLVRFGSTSVIHYSPGRWVRCVEGTEGGMMARVGVRREYLRKFGKNLKVDFLAPLGLVGEEEPIARLRGTAREEIFSSPCKGNLERVNLKYHEQVGGDKDMWLAKLRILDYGDFLSKEWRKDRLGDVAGRRVNPV